MPSYKYNTCLSLGMDRVLLLCVCFTHSLLHSRCWSNLEHFMLCSEYFYSFSFPSVFIILFPFTTSNIYTHYTHTHVFKKFLHPLILVPPLSSRAWEETGHGYRTDYYWYDEDLEGALERLVSHLLLLLLLLPLKQ